MVIRKNASMLLSDIQITNSYKNNMTSDYKTDSSKNKTEKEKVVDLAITGKARGDVRDYYRNSNDVQSAISRIQVAEHSLNSMNDMLIQMTELCIQAAKRDASPEDRRTISAEIQQLKMKMAQTTDSTKFNDQNVLDDFSLESLGLSDLDVSTPEAAQQAFAQVADAQKAVGNMQEDVAASRKDLEDDPDTVDLNRTYTIDASAFRDDVLSHAGESMLSQFSDDRELVMSLLK